MSLRPAERKQMGTGFQIVPQVVNAACLPVSSYNSKLQGRGLQLKNINGFLYLEVLC